MSTHGVWTSEYDWEISRSPRSASRETVLSVLFDSGTQRKFSSVRITLVLGDHVALPTYEAWQIVPVPSSLCVVDRHVSSVFRNGSTSQNDRSLSVCHVVFKAGRHPARLGSYYYDPEAPRSGEIVLAKETSKGSGNTIFDFDHPLSEHTQSVSISFRSSYFLCTMTSDVNFDFSSDRSVKVGRVVRILPDAPLTDRRAVILPVDVLLDIFEELRFPLTYRRWRKDVLSCALVCREWTCALGILLKDFRSEDGQLGCSPEIISFADALLERPTLGLGIRCLSASYFDRHPAWNVYPKLPSGFHRPMSQAEIEFKRNTSRRLQFAKAFLSVLRVARNVQVLGLDPSMNLTLLPDDLVDVLCELSQLQAFKGGYPLSLAEVLSCTTAWPSLKRLSILYVRPPSDSTVPPPSLSHSLTELELVDVSIGDDELLQLVSASNATLQRLALTRVSRLTNAGLGVTLNAVCASLTCLCITVGGDALERNPDDEHALDATIVSMVRLTTLKIVPEVASERMLRRRVEVFERRVVRLPEVHLFLVAARAERCCLVDAVSRSWSGWRVTQGLEVFDRSRSSCGYAGERYWKAPSC